MIAPQVVKANVLMAVRVVAVQVVKEIVNTHFAVEAAVLPIAEAVVKVDALVAVHILLPMNRLKDFVYYATIQNQSRTLAKRHGEKYYVYRH